jgi:hypothetical protein
MDGIQRVVAAILLAGAVAGAALIPRFLAAPEIPSPLLLLPGVARPSATVQAAPAPPLRRHDATALPALARPLVLPVIAPAKQATPPRPPAPAPTRAAAPAPTRAAPPAHPPAPKQPAPTPRPTDRTPAPAPAQAPAPAPAHPPAPVKPPSPPAPPPPPPNLAPAPVQPTPDPTPPPDVVSVQTMGDDGEARVSHDGGGRGHDQSDPKLTRVVAAVNRPAAPRGAPQPAVDGRRDQDHPHGGGHGQNCGGGNGGADPANGGSVGGGGPASANIQAWQGSADSAPGHSDSHSRSGTSGGDSRHGRGNRS